MVLLIGNYLPDRQQSMQRFSEMMLRELRALALEAELIRPPVFGGRFFSVQSSFGKWLAYLDKYLLFPIQLRLRKIPRLSLVHICDHSNAVYAPHFRSLPVVVTCHDLLAARGALGEETDCPASFTGKILQHWILRNLGRARAIACVSHATAADVGRLVRGKIAPKISVIENGLNYDYRPLSEEIAEARLKHLQLNHPFVLHVGSNLARKNRAGVLRIFAKTRKDWNAQLVFAGDAVSDSMWKLARELEIADRVIETISPDSELLEALYNRAHALLYPSRFEGFGWPIIEAQACGCPVVTSAAAPMSEIAGDGALLREISDEEGFAKDLLSLRNAETREKFRAIGFENAARFSARKMAERYLALYREAEMAA